MSFPAGSSGGPDGLRPQHLKDLLGSQEAGAELLTALTAFVNVCLAGRCPNMLASVFFGGRLIALNKKSGDVRPIVIGFTLRRLAAKCANAFGISRLDKYLSPLQLGVGTPGGCEAAIHSARRFLQSMPDDHVIVKLDFSNAFNCLHRKEMLMAVLDRLPELYAFIYSAYCQPSNLYFGPETLHSNEGPQQGDPIGPLLFSNAIHPLLLSLESNLTMGYLDDLTLAGSQAQVGTDVRRVQDVGKSMGLVLNVNKCEAIVKPGFDITDPLLASFQRITPEDATLLGAPLAHGPALDSMWSERCEDLERASERLRLIGSQHALMLLRASFGAPRVQHILRSAPSVNHLALTKFDKTQRSTLNCIINANLSDLQWLQATLPIKQGGLGVRRVSSLALPAFLASAASTLSLQDAILIKSPCPADSFVDMCLASWSSVHGLLPAAPRSSKQSVWDHPGIAADRGVVAASKNTPREKAIFLSSVSDHSGDWLSTLPIASCGLHLDDNAVRVAVAMRLDLSVCEPHKCQCGEEVDAWGSHAFVCRKAPGRITRHQAINDMVARAFTSAGVPVMKEPTGLMKSDGRRPDGLTLVPWSCGKALTWDVTVATTLADSYIISTSTTAGSAAEAAAQKKTDKYSDLPANYIFRPIALETLGSISSSAVALLNDLGNRIRLVSGEPKETRFLFQRLSILLQRYNSILLYQSFVVDDDPDLWSFLCSRRCP
jgi:hypothetical protein